MASSSMSNDASHDEQPCPYIKDSATFFRIGNSRQFEHVLQLYPQALRAKAEKRHKKPEKLIRLDDWFQNELPKIIKKRGKDAHLNHEELVQCMEWKQSRGKNFPQLSYLIKVNTPRAVVMETRKAFKKLPNIEQAIIALSNLKGVGTTMASALVAAACPEGAPFMADECLMAIPEIEGIDYTTKEYLNFAQHIQTTVNRLNSEHAIAVANAKSAAAAAAATAAANGSEDSTDGDQAAKKVEGSEAEPETTKPDDEDEDKKNSTDDDDTSDSRKAPNGIKAQAAAAREAASLAAQALKWSPHSVELALWTHYVASEMQPELLKDLPGCEADTVVSSNKFQQNGAIDQDEETIPDATDALTSNRVTALIASDKDLEEGSSSHDGPESMKLNGDDLPVSGNGTVAAAVTATEPEAVVGESAENSSDTATGTPTTTATTTMVNNVSSSAEEEKNSSHINKLESLEEGSSSRDEEAFQYKNGAGGNGDITSSTSPSSTTTAAAAETAAATTTTTPGGTKRFNSEPLTNVMAKCPKLMLDR